MNVGIVGASGYSGEVLVKLLLGHPQVKLTAVTSRQHAGKPVAQVIPALRGTGAEQLKFSDSDAATVAARNAPDHPGTHAPVHHGTLDDELALLVVHGVLHILGYDHAEPAEETAMQARERALLTAHHQSAAS